MNISEAANRSGLSNTMIRRYEKLGLIKPSGRTDAGYRQYSLRDIEQLRFIQCSRAMGFSLARISELLSFRDNPRRASREVKTVAEQHLHNLETKMRELEYMKNLLQDMISQCPDDDGPHCTILDALDSPAHPDSQIKDVEKS